MNVQRIKVKGLRNTREISQFTTVDGKKLKKNSLIRSSRLDKLPLKRRNKFLDDYNIDTVIDMRTAVEISEGKELNYPEDVTYHHVPVLDQAFFGVTHEKKMRTALFKESKKMDKEYNSKDFMVNMYKSIVFEEYSQNQFKEFFDILLNKGDGGIVFHCTGGKDRTGMASLFILTLLGVSKEDILADYAMSDYSNRHHNRILSVLIKLFIPYRNFKRVLNDLLYAKKEYLEKTIIALEEAYGSIINFLRNEIGITEEKQNRLKQLFLE